MSQDQDPAALGPQRANFATTHWSVVLAAQEKDSPQAAEALSELCQIYWYPVYAYVRRKGHHENEAVDLTQEFFCKMLERHFLRTADRRRGKFRSFLLGCLEHFLAKEWTRAHRKKRGGGVRIDALEDGTGEARYRAEAHPTLDPVKIFERRWAATVIEEGLVKLKSEYTAAGNAKVYESLKLYVLAIPDGYPELAAELGMNEGALRVALHRLRKRFGESLREVIAQTVSDPADIDGEVRDLMAALS